MQAIMFAEDEFFNAFFVLFFISDINRNFTIDMGTAKTQEFTNKDNKIAKYAKALGHPARIAILQLLLKKQNCIYKFSEIY